MRSSLDSRLPAAGAGFRWPWRRGWMRSPLKTWRPRPASSVAVAALAACSPVVQPEAMPVACTLANAPLDVGFYAFFAPVSYSASPDPSLEGFDVHVGYEADLLTAMEAMNPGETSFARRAIPTWPGIWLRSSDLFDIVGGGITILRSRTLGPDGLRVVKFTAPHIAFRQSLLARSSDQSRFDGYEDLTSDVRVGVLAGTTGEARLLRITGIAGEGGTLAAGTRVETPRGTVVADGTGAYFITAAGASENLRGRRRLEPPARDMPRVVYLGDAEGEAELLAALRSGEIDLVARGEIGNTEAARESGGAFAVVALDDEAEHGGFTIDSGKPRLLACFDHKIDWLTDGGEIGYAEWREDASVFMKRAELAR